ncbi:hypothetical protein WN944_007674 [Citrus x changshan-huyou]|uniref:Uncharacterized protein n=1 Tax=Citrus x changshan-huyou TaxID=2935761 RepID=A0AAP0QQM8_9ROSI
MLQVIQNLITCHNALGFCVGVSRCDPKGEKIQCNQNAHVMEFLVQLTKLRDGEENNVMKDLPIVLVNEFRMSKKADKIDEKENKLYDYYNMTVQLYCSNFYSNCSEQWIEKVYNKGDPKGEKIQYNQIANVMEFLVQLAKLRDGEGNNVMPNLHMVLVNEFGTSKKADKINEEEKILYHCYNKTMQF